jgi:hypothetical protein
MEQVVSPENATDAWRAVKRNGGAPGIDRMTTTQLRDHVRQHWESIRAKLLAGRYVPSPVRRVEIPKHNGGIRLLGIPTVLDRWIQQMLLQVLQLIFDPTFSAGSFGFRPGKSAHDAVRAAQSYVRAGKDWVVDMDITKFLDPYSYYVLAVEGCSKSCGWRSKTRMRKPFCLPQRTCTTLSSPRFTRCMMVCRDTPKLRMAWGIVTYPGGTSGTIKAFSSWVMRMRQGAPGVTWSPPINPSLSQRSKVEAATPS